MQKNQRGSSTPLKQSISQDAADARPFYPHLVNAMRAADTLSAWGLKQHYPFGHHFLSTPRGAMHYLDEGDGKPVLALHGNPTWSYIYRKLIVALEDTHRVVAPDLIGFGLSDKPTRVSDYSIGGHADTIEALILNLNLRDITLIVHDWGGPIGLSAASRHPERIRALVILNTIGFFPPIPGKKRKLPLPIRLMRTSGIGEILVRQFGVFERTLMPKLSAGEGWPGNVKSAYRKPFGGYRDRAGVLAFPRLIPDGPQHPSAQTILQQAQPFVESFKGPALIVWGRQDPIFTDDILGVWKTRLPQAETVTIDNASHYLQEDAPDILIPTVVRFLAATS